MSGNPRAGSAPRRGPEAEREAAPFGAVPLGAARRFADSESPAPLRRVCAALSGSDRRRECDHSQSAPSGRAGGVRGGDRRCLTDSRRAGANRSASAWDGRARGRDRRRACRPAESLPLPATAWPHARRGRRIASGRSATRRDRAAGQSRAVKGWRRERRPGRRRRACVLREIVCGALCDWGGESAPGGRGTPARTLRLSVRLGRLVLGGCGARPCRESASDIGTETVVEVIDGLWLPRPCAAASFLERLGCFWAVMAALCVLLIWRRVAREVVIHPNLRFIALIRLSKIFTT